MACTHASGRESTNYGGCVCENPPAQPRRQESSQLPGPFRQAPLAGFLPAAARSGDVTGLVFGAPVPQAPPPPTPVGLLVRLNVHLHRISCSKCLPVSRLKAQTQGPSSSPGARSELKIRVRVSRSRSRQYHGQLHF